MVDFTFRIILSLSFLGCAVYLIYLFVKLYRIGKQSANWSCINGIIVESKIEEVMRGDVPDVDFIIKYSYQIEGKRYEGNNLFFKPFDNNVDYTKKYPLGKQVKVYYNPDKPEESVLQKGLRPEIQFFIFWGLILAGIAYAISPL